ncbi:hypothetical protein GUJ93_ZPchr0013g36913 [Zizania palustris]|uniref:Uncharacterized protein n=1 Tax=Zizania palustris TaxID=103762 RepID=A0A8J5X7Z8_ZIZPA|nr:hypothetical protein GUJ93_ZPchr0013g36913 [Zizania palustris]KAG8099518.1 hypothetical protein GUJ93_ZPchr0013g36913 [Zizania palustris]
MESRTAPRRRRRGRRKKETFKPHPISRPPEKPSTSWRRAPSTNTQAGSHHTHVRNHGEKEKQLVRTRVVLARTRVWAMEGLIPFVIGAIRRSQQERGGYRGVSPDGSSHGGGGGSRRHLMIDYWELPGAAEDDGSAARARPGSVQPAAVDAPRMSTAGPPPWLPGQLITRDDEQHGSA